MSPVAIRRVSTSHPDNWIDTREAASRIAARTGDERRVMAIARGSQIARRATALSAEEIESATTIAERNLVYRKVAPRLATESARAVLDGGAGNPIGYLAGSSCTGYMIPGWDVLLAEAMELPADVVRVPLTQAGCSGGVLALARTAEYLRLHPERSALAVSVELCSLAFHADTEPGNLVSALLFGDGAGACLLEPSASGGLEIIDSASWLIPNSRDKIGFDLTDCGFYPRLAMDLAEFLTPATRSVVETLFARQGLGLTDLSFALLHPGGPRILDGLQAAFGLERRAMRWSYDSLNAQGNTSSAAIFDVIERFMEDPAAPSGWGLIAAFGPGVSIECLLVRRC